MGRGRAKAKQTKVARQLKYGGPTTDLEKLQAELAGSAGIVEDDDDDFDDEWDDPYAKYYDDDDDDEPTEGAGDEPDAGEGATPRGGGAR